jgi:polyisoprenyl-teichoic acid--peptidoglycan teichoic acid transferase
MGINRKGALSVAAAAVITLIIGGCWLLLHMELRQIKHDITHYNRNISEEIESQQSTLKKVGLNQAILFDKLNESRAALQLPQTEAISVQADDPDHGGEHAAGPPPGEDDSIFFDGINYLDGYYQSKASEQSLALFLETQDLRESLASLGLQVKKINAQRYALIKDEKRLFILDGEPGRPAPQLKITSRLHTEEQFTLDHTDATVEESVRFIRSELEEIHTHLQLFKQKVRFCMQVISGDQFSQLLEQRNLKIMPPENPLSFDLRSVEWRIRQAGTNGKDGGWISAFGVRFQGNSFFIDDISFPVQTKFKTALLQRIEQIDHRSPQEIIVAKAIEQIEKLSNDTAFQAFLAENGLQIANAPREEGDYFYFDLTDESGKHYGAFAVLKKHGKIYLTDHEDIVITELKTISTTLSFSQQSTDALFEPKNASGNSLNNLPDPASISRAGNSRETIILLCGTHEKNADTMMIARLAEDDGIRLISIPRDIYYKQRKISSYYRLYGITKLHSVLEKLTGVEFDGHITVDMYAFIDVVNILGGIEVHLDQPLIDPTYKIREKGEWKTLYFKAGEHHLDGIEALRVARSRHTSDDFDRAYRQQLVIQALYSKMNTLHAGKLQEVYKLFKVLYEYVDTDFSAYDLAQFFLKYHDADLQPKKSLSTDNILYTTYSNYYLSGLTEEEVDEDFYKGAWILLPKENKWDLIPRYVYQQLYTD